MLQHDEVRIGLSTDSAEASLQRVQFDLRGLTAVLERAQDPCGWIDHRAPATPGINVVLNWFEELKQRVPTGR